MGGDLETVMTITYDSNHFYAHQPFNELLYIEASVFVMFLHFFHFILFLCHPSIYIHICDNKYINLKNVYVW